MSFEDLCGKRVYEVARLRGGAGSIIGVVRAIHWTWDSMRGEHTVQLLVQDADNRLVIRQHDSVVVGLP